MNLLGSVIVPFREDNKAAPTEDELQHDLRLDKDPIKASQDLTPLAQINCSEDGSTGYAQLHDLSKYYQVMSLDEYTANTAAASRAARNAEIESRIQSFVPARAAKRGAVGSQEVTSPSSDAQAVPFTPLPLHVRPVALGKPRTSDLIIALHQFTEKHKFSLPKYEYRENGIKGAGTFAARLRIAVNVKGTGVGGQDGELPEVIVEDQGPFQSKKEAKEAISEKGLVLLKEKLAEIEIAQAQQGATGTAPAAATLKIETARAVAHVDPNLVPGENPIGLLLEFCSAKSLPQPSYQLYALDVQRFACELGVHFPSAQPIGHAQIDGAAEGEEKKEEEEELNLEPLTFGSQTNSYPSKKAAKIGAAAAAVARLRRAGHLDAPGSSPPRKRQRQVSSSSDTGMIVTQYPIDGLASPTAEEDMNGDTSDARLANLAHRLRLQLGLTNIEYRLKRIEGTAYYTGHGVFPMEGKHGFGAQLQGKVGELRDEVFGKKQAKEAVAREVVGILQAEVDKRAEAAGTGVSGQVREDSGVAHLGRLVKNN